MDYFVSIEDITYHHWQIELLIQSFLHHNTVDSLVIGIAENKEPKINFSNLKNVKRSFTHDNIGNKRGFLPLNKPYAVLAALENNLLNQPFTILHPDMLLVWPISPSQENVVFSVNPLSNNPLPLGNIVTFNNTPKDFFAKVIQQMENLEFSRQTNNDYVECNPQKFGWITSLTEYHQSGATLKPDKTYEMSLLDNKQNHFIHYKNGNLPIFHKKMFQNVFLGNPFQSLLNVPNNYTKLIAKSCVEKNIYYYPQLEIQKIAVKGI